MACKKNLDFDKQDTLRDNHAVEGVSRKALKHKHF